MKLVRIREDAYLNHHPPHGPWYISDDYTSVIPIFLAMKFFVEEQKNFYIAKVIVINNNTLDDKRYLHLNSDYHYISKEDVYVE